MTASQHVPHGRNLFKALAVSALAAALAACGTQQPSGVSQRGIEICRERKADSPAGSSSEMIRQAYRTCLKTIDAELRQQRQNAQNDRDAQSQDEQRAQDEQLANTATAAERYSHCQQVQADVIEAERLRIRTLGPAMVATRRSGADSPEARDAQAAYDDAVAELERLIPEAMRAGQALIPDAVNVFSRCDASDFNNP